MAYVVMATWKAKPGEEDAVLDRLRRVAEATRPEPGCLMFEIHRVADDPATFILYERFASEAAFHEHHASAHVRELVTDDAAQRLAERRRMVLELIPPD